MVKLMKVRSVSFDTSFLLHNKPSIDNVVKLLERDNIPCFITTTVVSELEQLKIWGRISKLDYKLAIKRWKKSHATVIDFKNRLLSDAFGKVCIRSMETYHGVSKEDIVNDCNILVSTLKNGVDLFLSEDFHFTSEITKEVIDEVTSAACTEFHQMCDSIIYSVDADTFLDAYKDGNINLDVVKAHIKSIRKSRKRL
jgi:hypothetical protein